ncbi:MAG: phosphoribosylamine--glycine ligase [Bacillota bacterium]|nr:phosphoribosylamine--glycine ligase [Bacillota bacterium]
MRFLVVGGGGREHALIWKLSQSPKVTKIYCAPGNGGTGDLAQNVSIQADDIEGLLKFALDEQIDWTIVGPEIPLMLGLTDKFRQQGLKAFGPSQKAAEIEGSKALAKELMFKYGIPTAQSEAFVDSKAAIDYINKTGAPCVVKADGLAAGKGVVVAMDVATAIAAVEMIMQDKVFGESGNKVIIEEFLEGEEVSILAFTDGQSILPMVSAQDHKRAYDGDEGPNTGGMGAYSPALIYTKEIANKVQQTILEPTIKGLAAEGRAYTGVIYAGLMLTVEGPKVLEYNARFGDPETQPVLMRLETDLVEVIEAIDKQELHLLSLKWSPAATVCVVMAAGGYPGEYGKGDAITGLDKVALEDSAVYVFQAGTKKEKGQLVTDGGRVLGVTARGKDIKAAVASAYKAVEKINFSKKQYRKDIAYKAL